MKNYNNLTQDELNNEFIEACHDGNLDRVRYLLTSPELSTHAEIDFQEGYGFSLACENRHFNIIKYLLTSFELKKHKDFSNSALGIGCRNGNLEIVKYLLTSSDLKEYADIHAYDDFGFRRAYERGYLEVIKFLIFDMVIEKTEPIKKFLKKQKHQEIENLFNVRELKKELESELIFSYNNKKNKL